MNKLLMTALLPLFLAGATNAQDKKPLAGVDIHTNAVCDMCKSTIEKELVYEKGVKGVHVDLAANVIHVDYDAKRTDPDKLRTAVTKLGYSADGTAPDAEARKALPACCQKEGCGMPAGTH
ncbi:MAG: cation transporter [Bacteroidetes bacterium]|nr:cation transporter [Bacteroidota bacterium]